MNNFLSKMDLATNFLTSNKGTIIPNRIFVGGISRDTTEAELSEMFSNYGNVISSKVIVDAAGVSKGYGFVTFKTEQEAQRLQTGCACIMYKDRKLNIAPAIKKSKICVANDAAIMNAAVPGNLPIYPPMFNAAAAALPPFYASSIYDPPIYTYYGMNMPNLWTPNFQGI